MIRVVIFLVAVGLLALGVVWLADRPGDVAITWQGWRVETSVMVLTVAVATVAVLAAIAWSVLRAILRSPDVLWFYLRTRRGVRGYLAVSQGLIAVGSGDARAAKKYADEANRIAPGEPLTLLLGAQTAQLSGDRAAAAQIFQAMAQRDDTKALGLHGLFIEAQRRDEPGAARLYAEEAAKLSRVPAWAGHAVFEFRCAAGDWTGALQRLDRNMKAGLLDKNAYRRQRAVLLTARALSVEDSDRDAAKAFVLEAVKLAPALVPAAALAGRLLGDAGEIRKAGRIVETAWKANPHPELAEAFAHLQPGDSARDRLLRVEALAQTTPGNVEAALAVARAALDAQEFSAARRALQPLVIVPTQRVAMLMAGLEEKERGDEGRAREWMSRAMHARRDPAWTADGLVSERWMPVSPVSGRLDAFQWKDPLSEIEPQGAVIEGERPERGAADAPLQAVRIADAPAPESKESDSGSLSVPALPVRPGRRRVKQASADPAFEKIIPLVQAPDDPGPEPETPVEPQAEPAPEAPGEGWNRLRQLFK
jgi:HemY protein